MTLREYYEQFHQFVTGEPGGDFTTQVAAEVAAEEVHEKFHTEVFGAQGPRDGD